jgi:hypothetical protein
MGTHLVNQVVALELTGCSQRARAKTWVGVVKTFGKDGTWVQTV